VCEFFVYMASDFGLSRWEVVFIQGVSGGIVNVLGGGSVDYSV